MNPSTLYVRIIEEYNMCQEEYANIIATYPTEDRFLLSARNKMLQLLGLAI